MGLALKIKASKRPFVIAGPCSVETEEQVCKTISDLALNNQVAMIRGGIWKPRTRPDSFEGIGQVGLQWLVNAAKEVNLPTTVEVANSKHVEQALKAGVDVLWIGARTTVNPFAVQEIADSLKGISIPVMIKNPINPDVQLWLGAFERLMNVGCNDLVAIHRGFSVYQHQFYRNAPHWEISINLKQLLPQIPVICDPSHIAGNRKLIFEVAQKAMDLNYDGLMIETHTSPDNAWSDAKQQLTPIELSKVLNSLILREKQNEVSVSEGLITLRKKVQQLDQTMLTLLSERMRLSKEIGSFKKENNITILQEELWERKLQETLDLAPGLELSSDFVHAFMDAVHLESIDHQMRVMNTTLNLKNE